jgi:hypothetical protein
MTNPQATGRFADISETDLAGVRTPADVGRIVERMRADLLEHPDEWENSTLERFLDALAAFLETRSRNRSDLGEEVLMGPAWTLFAESLVAATGYE